MTRKNKNGLGRCLIKDRFGKRSQKTNDTYLHTSDLNDGYDWGRLNLQSVTEESSFQEFLSTAELAGTEFQAEKLNISFVNPKVGVGILSAEQHKEYEKNKKENKDLLKIPRRPKWNEQTTAEELQKTEREDFLEWRRSLALLQEEEGFLLTTYEKNLDVWRQLWRVVERSDVVVQILDARNPLLFRCEDLEKYAKETDENKINMLLINKSDFLTEDQRVKWAKYFDSVGIKAVFFSAKEATLEVLQEESENESKEDPSLDTSSLQESSEEHEEDELPDLQNVKEDLERLQLKNNDLNLRVKSEDPTLNQCDNSLKSQDSSLENKEKYGIENSPKLLGRDDLIDLLGSFLNTVDKIRNKGFVTIGLAGYPNVGKSSTINALFADKKVSVSATPGKTKHFQTLYLRKYIVLCDCPGLVMPSFVSTKAEMVLNGILPIDQMRDHVSPTSLLTLLIPRNVLESEYGIMIPRPLEGEDPNRPPTHEELLNAYAYCRGFMTQNGQPDNPRASRYILKDFVNGRLLYCEAPPCVPQEEYHKFKQKLRKPVQMTAQAERAVRVVKMSGDDIDKAFFNINLQGVHHKGIQKIGPSDQAAGKDGNETTTKPWKNHKEKRNKKEKLRRVYRYLDE